VKYKLEHCIGNKLRRLSRIVDGQYRTALKEFGITENQMTLLFVLYSTGQIEQGLLGKKLILERSSISRNINVLIKNGYIDKSADYHPEVYLTAKGDVLVKRLIPIWERLMDGVIDKIGNDGVEMINLLEQNIR